MKYQVPAAFVLLVAMAASAPAQSPAELAQTAAHVAKFQNPDGGFAGAAGGESSLGATSSAIRILKYTGGSIPDVLGAMDYVRSCVDRASGGFAPKPGGAPGVGVTASGLMALGELKIADEAIVKGATHYLEENAKAFEEIRIAVAGFEAVGAKSAKFADWAKGISAERNPDGTWGQGAAVPRATGSAAVALLRMGVDLDKADAVIDTLKAAQRPDGGWSKDGQASDLETSYRIMRCFFMMKKKPDLDRLRSFLASRRQADGGYSPAPGKPSDLGGTYFCTIMGRWARLLDGEPAFTETVGFQPLFNGKDLTGWEGDTSLWSARDGMLVGTSQGLKKNDFLATEKSYGDFILKLKFRLIGEEGSNSGVQFRSIRVPDSHEMSGYQADIGKGYWGSLYDESRRNRILAAGGEKAEKALHPGDWNEYVVRAMGGHINLYLNGVQTVDYKENDADVARAGKIAVQIHAGGPMQIQFKDVMIQPLPTPTADEAMTPGFHLRTVRAQGNERKYTLYLPTGYNGEKRFPVVLFLHGSGERGEDGITSAQVGLGAAIHEAPEKYPFIAVFPQARQTWSADSDDARAALAALDDVLKACKADATKVVLTGLSMGGGGSWSIAGANPDRFSAVVPICGFGSPQIALATKDLPLWTLIGDDDNMRLLGSTREMVRALKEAGAPPRYTEYRGVGHNSWDRAYHDPSVISWMLEQTRKPRL